MVIEGLEGGGEGVQLKKSERRNLKDETGRSGGDGRHVSQLK